MRTFVEKAIQSAARRLGYRLQSYKTAPYGLDPWRDLERLAGEWQIALATAFDVGANIGQTATLLKKLWPAMRIVCFEPTPDTFATLQQTISGLRDVTAENIGLGASAGSFDLFTYPDDPLLNSLSPNSPYVARFASKYETMVKKVSCTVRTLDEVRRERGIERINLLKIDTEGFDLQVLEGARQSFSEGRIDFVYLEFNTVHPRDGASGGALAPLASFLTPFGFHLVSTYTDWLLTTGEFFSGFNALFARRSS
jgi:FkbM family methyltransferase